MGIYGRHWTTIDNNNKVLNGTAASVSPSNADGKRTKQQEAKRRRDAETKMLKDTIKDLTCNQTEQSVVIEQLQDDSKKKDTEIHNLQTDLTDTKAKLTNALEKIVQLDTALKNTGTVSKAHLKPEMVTCSEKIIKTVIFRTWKFVEDEADIVKVAEKTYDWLKKVPNFNLTLDKQEYASQ